LDRIKRNNSSPSPQSNDEGAKEQKRASSRLLNIVPIPLLRLDSKPLACYVQHGGLNWRGAMQALSEWKRGETAVKVLHSHIFLSFKVLLIEN